MTECLETSEDDKWNKITTHPKVMIAATSPRGYNEKDQNELNLELSTMTG